MATQYAQIKKANFSTTAYSYHETSAFAGSTWYWFYKSNVSWDVYIYSLFGVKLRFDFYDYDLGSWIPFTDDLSTVGGYGFQYAPTAGQNFRFFHNCLQNYNNSAYTATYKIVDDKNLSHGNYTYDTRGYSLWRIGFYFVASSSSNDFNINSRGPGFLTDAEYNEVCKGKRIYCGGKGDPNSDDQHIVSGNPSVSDFSTRFLPSVFSNQNKLITADLDRQCIPDWTWARRETA